MQYIYIIFILGPFMLLPRSNNGLLWSQTESNKRRVTTTVIYYICDIVLLLLFCRKFCVFFFQYRFSRFSVVVIKYFVL